MINKIDLTNESYELPLTLIVDGKSTEFTLTDIPLAVYRQFAKGGDDVTENIALIENFALHILNSNKEGKVFDKEFLKKLGTAKITVLVQSYSEWLNDVLSSKN